MLRGPRCSQGAKAQRQGAKAQRQGAKAQRETASKDHALTTVARFESSSKTAVIAGSAASACQASSDAAVITIDRSQRAALASAGKPTTTSAPAERICADNTSANSPRVAISSSESFTKQNRWITARW